jgi:sulfate transport system substrate-binding protein
MVLKANAALVAIALLLTIAGCSPGSDSARGFTSATSKGKPAITLTNASYDPTRELYQEVNEAFTKYWKQETGQDVSFKQSHQGSGKQARAVIDGLKADVVTLALSPDIDEIAKATTLLPADWQKRLPNNSCPYTSTIVFLVRKGNPKQIQDWDDLVKEGVEVITPNPKSSGGARWAYLAAWGHALRKNGQDETKARDFVQQLYAHVPVLGSGARESTTTFLQNGIGDVLLSWENEALLAIKKTGNEQVEIVSPPVSILAEPPVAVIDQNAGGHGAFEAAKSYLQFLYLPEGQQIIAKNFYRPSQPKYVDKELLKQFADIKLFTVEEVFGSWMQAQTKHFSDGGTFDFIQEANSAKK